MAGDDLEQLMKRVFKHAASYRESLGERPHNPQQSYAETLAAFQTPLPEAPLSPVELIEELAEKATPGLMSMAGPRFYGWVIGGTHPAGMAADWLTSAWGQNAGNHHATPAAAAAEEVAALWLLDLLDLPRACSVGMVTGATMATTVCLAAARGEVLRRAGWNVEADGLFGAPPISVLIGDDAHATVFFGLQMLGLGGERVQRIASDKNGRIDAGAFREAADKIGGPMIAITQAGQLNTGAFDPFTDIAEATHEKGGWMHVDGAFGLWARACEEVAPLAEGVDLADSWAVDGHKWLQTPHDIGYAIVRDARAHARAMALSTSYLPPVAAGERSPSDFVPELSRRARGFATWAMIKALGRQGISEMVGEHCRLTRHMAARLSDAEGVFVLNDVALNQFIVRFGEEEAGPEGDAATQEVIARVQEDGTCFLGGAVWRGAEVMRVSVIGYTTTEKDIDMSVDAILAIWRTMQNQ